jgi:hypothetical protein
MGADAGSLAAACPDASLANSNPATIVLDGAFGLPMSFKMLIETPGGVEYTGPTVPVG